MEIEEIEEIGKKKEKVIRVIFRTFPTFKEILFSKKYNFKTSLNIFLTKLITTPLNYKGYVYDHSEVLSPKRQRFGIRKDPFGVYLINKNGFWDPKNQELLNQKYKLVFVFQVTQNQENLFYNFVKKHKGEEYNGKITNFNYIIRKNFKCLKKLIINSEVEWDCVTLSMKVLLEMGLIPEFRKNGKNTPLLGLSSHDFAMLLLDMYQKEELAQCSYVISTEIQDIKEYKEMLKVFYEEGCKIIRQ